MILEDGTGTNNAVKVDDDNRLHVKAVSDGLALDSTKNGNSYNLNTGIINITGNATLMYLKNNGDKDIVIEAIALGALGGATHSESPYITLVRNPTGGDLITDATTSGTLNQNRNFGSNNQAQVDFYKGKTGGTLSGGDDIAILQTSGSSRSFYTINFVLPKGSSMAVKLEANISSGSSNWYAAFIIHE